MDTNQTAFLAAFFDRKFGNTTALVEKALAAIPLAQSLATPGFRTQREGRRVVRTWYSNATPRDQGNIPGRIKALTTAACDGHGQSSECLDPGSSFVAAEPELCLGERAKPRAFPWLACGLVPLPRDCLVISIGIGGEWAFEDALVKAGCEVHAFDPTSDLRASHEAHARAGDAKLHFHYVGLGAGANYTATNHSNSYGALSSEFLPLDALIATAKRGRDVPLTILKVDCEGCEWDAFADAARRAPHALDDVSMLMIELHLTERLGMRDAASLSTLMRHVVGDHRFRLSRQHTNHGFAVDWNAARPELVSAGWEAHPCCAELHFVRAPDGAEQAAERERGGPV